MVNASESLPVSANATAFTFANKLVPGGSYNVTIGSQPAGLACSLSNAGGTVAQADVQTITVNCTAVQGNGSFTVSTFAGDDRQTLVDGVSSSARFGRLLGIAVDTVGQMYVSDDNGYIRKVSTAGAVTSFVGPTDLYGPTVVHGLTTAGSMAVDNSGNVYAVDTFQRNMIFKVSRNGVVSLLAGTSLDGGFVDGTGAAARFRYANCVAVDGAGNVYVSDYGNHAIRKISPAGAVSTLAGTPTPGFADGAGGSARFNGPTGIAVDSTGNVYVVDTGNFAIRKITPAGVVSTLVGAGPNSSGFVDGAGSTARLASPTAVALDSAGGMYIADSHAIRKVSATGVLSTIAGGTVAGFADGGGTAAQFNLPVGMVVDSSGNIAVADSQNRAVRLVTPTGVVTTLAGQGPVTGLFDGTATAARFYRPRGVATDVAGNVYVADLANLAIRKITSGGVVTTLAGSGGAGNVDATGPAARFTSPTGVAADGSGNVYVVDNGAIRKVTAAGVVTTLPLQINSAQGIAVDGAGALFIAANHSVFKMSPTGVLTTLAGNGSAGFADGLGAAARFNAPLGLAVDSAGNVYVADSNNNALRKISPQGQVTTLAAARFVFGSEGPESVAVDGTGNVYVIGLPATADAHGHGPLPNLTRFSSDGVATLVMGPYLGTGLIDGPASVAFISSPRGIAIDSTGNVYVSDFDENDIRKIVP